MYYVTVETPTKVKISFGTFPSIAAAATWRQAKGRNAGRITNYPLGKVIPVQSKVQTQTQLQQ